MSIDENGSGARPGIMRRAIEKKYRSRGYTLVEIMVAVAITFIVMGGVYRAMMEDTVGHERSENIIGMQNNARVALDRIVRDVRRAGFFGCGGELTADTLSNSGATAWVQPYTLADVDLAGGVDWSGEKSILATIVDDPGPDFNYLGETLGFLDSALNDSVLDHGLYLDGTDAITLVYLAGERVATMTAVDSAIDLDSAAYDQGDILYITDCQNHALFQKTNGPDDTVEHADDVGLLNTTTDLGLQYGALDQARIYQLNVATYYIKKGTFSLYRNNYNLPIADNIEDLQFEFLADENLNDNLSDDPWRTNLASYASANDVKAIRIWLLAMSEPDFSYTDTNTYVYTGSPYAASSPASLAPMASPGDGEHRYRYLTSAVVYLRNAGL